MKDVLISIFQSGCLYFAWYKFSKLIGCAVMAYLRGKMRRDAFLRLQLRMGEEPMSLTIFWFLWTILTIIVWGLAFYNIYLSIQAL